MDALNMSECGGLEIDLHNCAEEILYLLGAHGVDYLFLNPGTDSAPLQEAALTLKEKGVQIPRIITCSFESVALAAAHGYWQRTGLPQAVFVHVDVGTQNLGAMVHNILRDRAGVVVMAGKTPYSEDSNVPGSRSSAIHWQQDVPDQAGILRGYAKWTFELSRSSETSRVIGRALQIAAGGVPGLAYLMLSRDVLMDAPSDRRQRRLDKFARPSQPAMNPTDVEQVADLLMGAANPVIIAGRLGLAGINTLGELASMGSIPVISRLASGSLSSSHPMSVRSENLANELIEQSDLLLVIECDVPWVPSHTKVISEATIIQIDSDPIKADMPLWSFPVDKAVNANGDVALKQLYEVVSEKINCFGHSWSTRADNLKLGAMECKDASVESNNFMGDQLDLRLVFENLNLVINPEDVVLVEAVSNNPVVMELLERHEPGNLCSSGGPGLGWALGASVGVKLANPERRVIAIVGDGAFMFGVPTSALCLAAESNAPFIALVLNNNGYRASRLPVYKLFPKGASVLAGAAIGTRFAHPPDFALIAQACGAYGKRVDSSSQLMVALQEAVVALGEGRSAVIDIHLLDN